MEFHAFILCGSGKGLSPFSQSRTTGVSKALLPIANKPMVEYVLEWCDRAFFPQVTVVCDEASKEGLQAAVEQYQSKLRPAHGAGETAPASTGTGAGAPASGASAGTALSSTGSHTGTSVDESHGNSSPPPIDIMVMDANSSGEVLYNLYKRYGTPRNGVSTEPTSSASSTTGAISGGSNDSSADAESRANFVLLPCDFVTDLPPQVLIEAYRNKPNNDLGLWFNYHNHFESFSDKKTFGKTFGSQINYTVYSELEGGELRLLDLFSKDDIDFHKSLQLRTQMSWRHANATVATKLLDSSIFFGNTERVFNVFDEEESSKLFTEFYFRHRSVNRVIRDLARRTWKHSEEKESIGFSILPKEATFFRCNNIPVYMEANRYIMKQQQAQSAQTPVQVAAQPLQQSSSQSGSINKLAAVVGADSLVDPSSVLGERTNVKRSVIGKSCTIGKRVKLTGCILLNNITVEDDVHLENCIIGHNVTIQSKVKLTHCNVESTLEVAKGTQAKGEDLLCLSLEGIVEGHGANANEEDLDFDDEYAIGEYSDSDSDSEDDSESEGELDEHGDNSDGLFAY
ncbi:translation initiation factor eIF-2B subunit gamma [[Candida] railenensis]|uniref:Translation initiation factor eIF2B subunit gamma n=1 Tax=[Candida] railenensis TaxID=45579 RepID=A0A9P0QKK2_9ASCO|nr:translation initiation factor eIF-2B subunit gamma [[Candida] railenensis]